MNFFLLFSFLISKSKKKTTERKKRLEERKREKEERSGEREEREEREEKEKDVSFIFRRKLNASSARG